jgi:hypothetical protein
MFDAKDFDSAGGDVFGDAAAVGTPLIGEDTIVRLLSPATSGFVSGNPPVADPKKTQEGIDRVNQNSKQTGVVGYKDNKGQATFTNVARNSDGVEQPIYPQPTGIPTQKDGSAASNVPVPIAVGGLLDTLKKATNQAEAQSAFEAVTGAITQGNANVEKNAFEFASNKFGIPTLERQLMEAEQADKADPKYYPGVGDSHITAQIRTHLQQLRASADVEAKRMLGTNLGYVALDNMGKMATLEFQRKVKLQDQQDQKDYNDELLRARKKEANDAKDQDLADSISNEVLSRMQILNPADFSKDDQGTNPALKAARLLKGNKNKGYVEALTAEGDQLPVLAIQGNTYATAIVAAKEATLTNRSADAVKADIESVKKLIDRPDFLTVWAKATGTGKDKAGQMFAQLEALKDNKHEATARKVRMALEIVAAQKTNKFTEDVSSWDSIDPGVRTAIDVSRKTTGNANLENVLTSYVGDSTGTDRATKIVHVRDVLREAALKQKDSLFGMPDYRKVESVINHWATRGFFGKIKDSVMQTDLTGLPDVPVISTALTRTLPGSFVLGAGLDLKDAFTDKAAETDPTTGRKFGE